MRSLKSLPTWSKILAGVVLVAIWLGLWTLLSIETLLRLYADAHALGQKNPGSSLLIYALIYIFVAAIGLPAATMLTLFGGAMFGWAIGSVVTVLAATAGACLLFLASRGLFGEGLTPRTGGMFSAIQREFKADAAGYLLLARLAPVFPFTVVTLAAASLGARFSTFAWTTLFGIIPGTAAYSYIGAGLNAALLNEATRIAECRTRSSDDCRTMLEPAAFVTREIVLGLAALALVMLISLAIRRIAARRSSTGQE